MASTICVVFLLLISFALAVCAGTISYFTASAEKGGTLTFANLEVQILNSEEQPFDDSVFQQTYVQDLLPGSTININNIKVKNTGEADAYVMLNLVVNITKIGAMPLNYDKWFNCEGKEVDVTNFVTTPVGADLLTIGEVNSASVKFIIPGADVTNDYKQATVSVELKAEAIQSNLPDAVIYQNVSKYAAYKIYAEKLGIYEGDTESAVVEPLRKINGVGDSQSDGVITRNIGVAVLDGSEDWNKFAGDSIADAFQHCYRLSSLTDSAKRFQSSYCTHFSKNVNMCWRDYIGQVGYFCDHPSELNKYFCTDKATLEEWRTWLEAEYDAGHPVILFYQLATPITQ